MKVIIIDDEPKAIALIASYISHFSKLEVVATFRNGLKALEFLNSNVVDVVFLELHKEYDFLKMFNSGLNPSSEWRFHQDIYLKKKESKAIVHAHSPHATAVSAH